MSNPDQTHPQTALSRSEHPLNRNTWTSPPADQWDATEAYPEKGQAPLIPGNTTIETNLSRREVSPWLIHYQPLGLTSGIEGSSGVNLLNVTEATSTHRDRQEFNTQADAQGTWPGTLHEPASASKV